MIRLESERTDIRIRLFFPIGGLHLSSAVLFDALSLSLLLSVAGGSSLLVIKNPRLETDVGY